ncbi:MAG: flagellar basal body rod protein FlgB [Alphaproteobacteria bacterium]
MNVESLNLIRQLGQKMNWLDQRQRLLSENIANANTPGYQPRDLAKFEPEKSTLSTMPVEKTNPKHIQSPAHKMAALIKEERKPYDVTPSGNSVVLEDQMRMSAENAVDHQAITQIYRKQMNLLKTAIGRGGSG